MEPRFFNRELSWIEFNGRVLHQALRKDLPLLERLQFLSIISSNFDEFFQVRVASVKRLLFTNPEQVDVSGLTPELVLHQISARAHQIIRSQHDCLKNDVLPEFAKKNICYLKPEDFSITQAEYAQNFLQNDVYPVLTPLRTDTEIFPHIGNLAKYAAFLLKPISGIRKAVEAFKGDEESPRIALVQIPSVVPQVLWLPGEPGVRQFALTEEIITQYGRILFPGFNVEETLIFKVARDADFAVDEDSGQNFIHEMEKVLVKRQSSFPVEITCNSSSETILKFLMDKLELKDEDVYRVEDFVDPGVLMALREIEGAEELSYPVWNHFYPADLPQDEPYWDVLKQKDVLLHVPYESYDPVIKFKTEN